VCGVKPEDSFLGREQGQRLGVDEMMLVLQAAMLWACVARGGWWLGEGVCGV